MATLQKLIENGLQVGQLVKNTTKVFQVLTFYGKYVDLHNIETGFCRIDIENNNEWKLTTAYDEKIFSEMLPVAEPFATGWVVTDYNGQPYKFEPIEYKKESVIFEDGWHQEFYKSDCMPCLPPAYV